MQIEIDQAPAKLPELIEEAMNGSDVVITRNHEPLVRLVEARPPTRRQRQPGSCKGLITIADDFDEPLEDFRNYT